MKPLGQLVRIAQGRGLLEHASDEVPDTGTAVLDETLDEVGHVIAVIGPVDRPWIVITPTPAVDLVDHLGDRLYTHDR